LNENLLESELFGHVRGAFTGAEKNRVGRFEAAHEGSIFLDEIGDLPLSIQVKLLRVLEEKTIERVGDHQPIPVDVRIITATNKNLDDLVARGQFREDLFFRINVFPLYCPPLHRRIEDIPAIVRHFIRLNTETTGKRITGVTPEAMDSLVNYSWPGNIRELRNAIEYAFVLCPGDSIGRNHLPHRLTSGSDAGGASGSGYSCNPKYRRLPDQTDEKRMLLNILRETGWNQSETARRMGISRVTVWKRMRKYGIRRD
jgi:transcriptional regulator with PAS, ATPase and Fis domain